MNDISQPRSAKEAVTGFFAALRGEGVDAALDYVAEDAVFIAVLGDDFKDVLPMYGRFIGKDGVRAFVASLADNFDTQEFVTHKVIAEGDHVALWGRFHHRIKSTGKDFHSDWALICETRDGQISHYQFYEDTAALEAAFDRPGRTELT